MKFWFLIGCAPMLIGCPKNPEVQVEGGAKIRKMEALGMLMKNEINPAFSKLGFLLFHGATVEEDPKVIRAELQIAASKLQLGIRRLRDWQQLPTETSEGRDVFITFANSVDKSTEQLVTAISRNDDATAQAQLEKIADTCNNCHHFFRLDIEDSVVSRTAITHR